MYPFLLCITLGDKPSFAFLNCAIRSKFLLECPFISNCLVSRRKFVKIQVPCSIIDFISLSTASFQSGASTEEFLVWCRISFAKNINKSSLKVFSILFLLLLLGSDPSDGSMLDDGADAAVSSHTWLVILFLYEKMSSKKVASLASIMALLIFHWSQSQWHLMTKDLLAGLSNGHPIKIASIVLGPIFFLFSLGISTLAKQPYTLRWLSLGALFFHSS